MLFDESAIIAAHRPLIRNGDLGDAYRTGTMACVRLIENVVRSPDIDRAEATVVADLGARTVNACGAASLLALSGYWSPAVHQLRDIVECHQLFELFRLNPPKAVEWKSARGPARYRQFGFGQVRKLLEEKRGPAAYDLQAGFDLWSSIGTHPSSASLAMHMTATGKVLGPTADPDRFRLFTGDLWAHMTRSTLEFIATMDSLLSNRPTLGSRFRFELAVVEGARALLAAVTAADVLATWK
jgi:hypothetical protein